MNIELKSCSTIQLTNCTADSLSLTNLEVDKLQIQFTKCEFNTLDYSESNLWTVDDSWFVDNKVQKVILPNTVEKINWSKYYIDELVFPTLDNIKSIKLKLCPRVFYSTFDELESNMIIDLSKLDKLEEVIFVNIQSDTMLPGKLNSLVISQDTPNQLKILNNRLACKSMTATGFDVPWL